MITASFEILRSEGRNPTFLLEGTGLFYSRSPPAGSPNCRTSWKVLKSLLQADEPDDFVLATGETRSVREFVELAFAEVGRGIEWRSKGVEETGVDTKSGKTVVRIDPTYFRPTEVDLLVGDTTKAREKLGWKPKIPFAQLVKEMVAGGLAIARREVANGRNPV
jgi:GDPmannose 4,6-dehydratase